MTGLQTAGCLALVMACTGCAPPHTVAVLAPAEDVPLGASVSAIITPGNVEVLARGVTLVSDGRLGLAREGTMFTRVKPTDTLAIAARGGDVFGAVRVRHKSGGTAMIVAGLTVLLGGLAATWSAVGVDLAGRQNQGCILLCGFGDAVDAYAGFLGSVTSVVVGGVLLAWGINGPLAIDNVAPTPRVSFTGHGVLVRF